MHKPLREQLKAHFSDVFSKVYRGQSLGIQELEKLDILTTRFANDLEAGIERVTLDKAKKLNDAIKFGFEQVAKDIADAGVDRAKLLARMQNLEDNMVKVHDVTKRLITEVNKRPIASSAPADKPARGTPIAVPVLPSPSTVVEGDASTE